MSITAVHPMRADAVRAFLKKAQVGWGVIDRLFAKRQLRALNYQGHTFYLRTLQRATERGRNEHRERRAV